MAKEARSMAVKIKKCGKGGAPLIEELNALILKISTGT
tara:strand:- start:8 stop:121 length:114 start_codon:yes stop_codon:yes gene_type:complete